MKLPPRYCRAGSEKQLAWTGRKTALGSTQAGTQIDRVPGMRITLARAMMNQRKYRSGRSWTILVSVRAKATLVQLVATAANHADVFWYRKKARRASSDSSWTTAMVLLTRAPAINNRTCGQMSVSDGWPRQRVQEGGRQTQETLSTKSSHQSWAKCWRHHRRAKRKRVEALIRIQTARLISVD